MFNKKVPFFMFLLSALLGGSITFIIIRTRGDIAITGLSTAAASTVADCNYNVKRRDGFTYIRPLLFAEKECESPNLLPLKDELSRLVEGKRTQGVLQSASVYVRVFSKGEWICYNDTEHFHPASLNKVATLITYLRAAESTPGLLDQKIVFKGHDSSIAYHAYSAKSLQAGKVYTVREILHYMIAYSDNEATFFLLKNINPAFNFQTYTDLGLPKPEALVGLTQITASEYSVFMKVIYNATYLNAKSSEYCSQLLTECEFNEGLMRGLPSNIKVAHKFGEFRDSNGSELHEAGIIYNGDKPYLIVVMTKGPDGKQLRNVISEISGLVFRSVSSGT